MTKLESLSTPVAALLHLEGAVPTAKRDSRTGTAPVLEKQRQERVPGHDQNRNDPFGLRIFQDD